MVHTYILYVFPNDAKWLVQRFVDAKANDQTVWCNLHWTFLHPKKKSRKWVAARIGLHKKVWQIDVFHILKILNERGGSQGLYIQGKSHTTIFNIEMCTCIETENYSSITRTICPNTIATQCPCKRQNGRFVLHKVNSNHFSGFTYDIQKMNYKWNRPSRTDLKEKIHLKKTVNALFLNDLWLKIININRLFNPMNVRNSR